MAKGYDQNWVLDNKSGKLAVAAIAYDPGSGRTLEISTTEPGVLFYTSNHMEGIIPGKHGKTCGFRTAFCLETEHFPDSPNHPSFPSTELKPGQRYETATVFKLGTGGPSTLYTRRCALIAPAPRISELPHPRETTDLNYQTNEVIESGGSSSFNARVPSVHCTCCSPPLLLVTTSTLLPSVFLAATCSIPGKSPEEAKMCAPF